MPTDVARAAEGFPARWRWKVIELDPSVTDAWRAHAHASWIEKDLVVVPAWLPFESPPGTTVVRIEPGVTFGLGDHPTTVLTIRGLRAAMRPGARVLDVGCGSGVLAVTAAVLGAASEAIGIDVSPASPPVAHANAEANGVASRVHVSTTPLADDRRDLRCRRGQPSGPRAAQPGRRSRAGRGARTARSSSAGC